MVFWIYGAVSAGPSCQIFVMAGVKRRAFRWHRCIWQVIEYRLLGTPLIAIFYGISLACIADPVFGILSWLLRPYHLLFYLHSHVHRMESLRLCLFPERCCRCLFDMFRWLSVFVGAIRSSGTCATIQTYSCATLIFAC